MHTRNGALSVAVVASLLASCAPDAVRDEAVLRQAAGMVTHMPVAQGTEAGARLGTSVAACRLGSFIDPPFVAGAPGQNAIYLYDGAQVALTHDGGSDFGVGSLCIGVGIQPEIVGWGRDPNAFRRTPTGSVEVITLGGVVDAMARTDSTNSSYLVGVSNTLFSVNGGSPAPFDTNPAGNVRIACLQGTSICAVAHRNSGARVYGLIDGGALVINPPDGGNRTVSAIAIGDLHPAPGPEVAIGGDGVVDVYSVGPRGLLYTLHGELGVTPGFGTSLGVDVFDAGAALRSLWVGSPQEARVYRFFGDAGDFVTEQSAPVGSEFGHSLALEANGGLLIGAPRLDDTFGTGGIEAGAVFRDLAARWVPLGAINGVQLECVSGQQCQVGAGMNCRAGVCIGGVVCAALSNCSLDAGSDAGSDTDAGADAGSDAGSDAGFDAGSDAGFDAGTVVRVDAGSVDGAVLEPDASVDAGEGRPEPDAGMPPTSEFRACGCDGATLGPLALLGLVLLRRRVWAKVRHAR